MRPAVSARRAGGPWHTIRPAFLFLAALSAGAAVCAAAGQGGGPAPAAEARLTDSAAVVKVAARPARLAAAPGRPVSFALEVRIDRGWHLYAHGDTMYYGIALVGLDASPLREIAVEYPPGREGVFFGQPVLLLDGRQRIAVRGVLADTCRPGRLSLPLAVEVQACDDQRCLAPAAVPAPVVLQVRAGR